MLPASDTGTAWTGTRAWVAGVDVGPAAQPHITAHKVNTPVNPAIPMLPLAETVETVFLFMVAILAGTLFQR
jgi:hypothetical protein